MIPIKTTWLRKRLNEDGNVVAILGVIMFMIMILIGVLVLSETQEVVNPMLNISCAAAVGTSGYCSDGLIEGMNDTYLGLIPQMTGGYGLLVIGVIVLAAAALIGVLAASFMKGRPQ